MKTYRTVHPALVIAALRAAGYTAVETRRPRSAPFMGCTDPAHCFQLPSSHTGRDGVTRPVCGVESNAPGNAYNRLVRAAWAEFMAHHAR